MKFRIHWEKPETVRDSIVIEGESVEEIQAKANEALTLRGLNNDDVMVWSEEIK